MKTIKDLIAKQLTERQKKKRSSTGTVADRLMCMEFTAAVNPVEWTRVRLLSLRQRSRPRLKQAITNPSGGWVGCARVSSNAIRRGWCSDSDKTGVPGSHLDSGMGVARGGNFTDLHPTSDSSQEHTHTEEVAAM